VMVPPGAYILLQPGKQALWRLRYSVHTLLSDGSPLQVALTEETARPRHPTHFNTSARESSTLDIYE